MELKDYLHLYIGCEVVWGSNTFTLVGVFINAIGELEITILSAGTYYRVSQHNSIPLLSELKPKLRPLSSMTEDEGKEFHRHKMQVYGYNNGEGVPCVKVHYGLQTNFLLSKHFDLFGLIEAGLAVEAKTEILETQK